MVVVKQGDVYWVDLGEPKGSEPAGIRPALVVQGNHFNRSDLNTVIVCLITSQLRRESIPGNVRLSKGEANLPKPSVVTVTQLFTIDRSSLTELIGTLSPRRVMEVVDGISFVLSASVK